MYYRFIDVNLIEISSIFDNRQDPSKNVFH